MISGCFLILYTDRLARISPVYQQVALVSIPRFNGLSLNDSLRVHMHHIVFF